MAPKLSVSEFVAVFNQSLEMLFPEVTIVGELANFRINRGQWVYFDLKDEESSVKFFGASNMLPGPLEDGMNVEVVGSPRLHNRYGFSVNSRVVKVVGEGSIAKAQALLARKLENEGLFNPERKRLLPYPPDRIGLITSVESAAYGDFIKIINQRWGNIEITVADSLVQGIDAPAQIIRAIELSNQLPNPPEVLVLTRGGGSADDLAAFSVESVVRAVASSRIPTLIAIGHTRDVSLSELAADQRASTPSNAAELLTPDKTHEMKLTDEKKEYLQQKLAKMFDFEADTTTNYREELQYLLNKKFDQNRQNLAHSAGILRVLDPQTPFKRGFALVRNARGQLVKSVSQTKKGEGLAIKLADGKIDAEVL